MRGASGDDPDGDEDAQGTPIQGSDAGASGEGDASSQDAHGSTPGSDADRSAGADPSERGRPESVEGNAPAGSNTPGDTVDAAEIDPSELTVSERSLHPRIRVLWIVRAVVWAFVLGGIVSAGAWAWLDAEPAIWAGIVGGLVVLFVAHAILRYRAWSYEFREDAIYLERGVLTRVRTVVPFVRIQHIDTARGPIERAAGLSTLVVYTAGSRGADVTIPGIEAERATDHQRRLKQLAIAAEDDTAV